MQTIIAALLSLLVLQPIEAAIGKQFQALGIPRENTEKIVACARTALPAIASRVGGDPIWGLTQVFRFWLGAAKPDDVLIEIAPQCAGPLEAARQAQSRRI